MKKVISLLITFMTIISICSALGINSVSAYGSLYSPEYVETEKNYYGNVQSYSQENWYSFKLTDRGYINISFSHEYVNSAFDQWEYWEMDLYNADKEVLGSWKYRGNELRTVKTNNIGVPKGIYYIAISAANNLSTLDYNFRISYSHSSSWESEFNDTLSTANDIVLNKSFCGTIRDFSDNDWYKINISQNGQANISFGHEYVDSAFDHWEYWVLTLYDNNMNTLASWRYKGNEMKTVNNRINVNKGTYYVLITSANNLSSLDYDFKISQSINPNSIKLNQNSLILGAGESYTLNKTISPSNATQNVTWSSSNTSVATVSNGKVTAKKSGTAYITVKTSNGKTAQCKVTVKSAPASVKTNPTSLTLGKGETYTISESTNSGSYANAANLKWSTSNSSVATVTKGSGNKAKITAKGTGTAYIKIKLYNGKTAQCKVTVKPAPTSVKTNPTSLTLGKGETYTISESTNSGSYANAANLKWSTSNSSVATVTKGSGNKAKIIAKGTGTAYIKIKLYNGKTAQCKVTVKSAPTSVKLSKTSITLKKGQTYTISESTNSGTYANAANLKWSSSNSSVATVTKGSANKAVIKAKSKGTAYIKIKLYNGKTAQCKVTVK